MTGFAAQTGTGAGHSWSWEARSVNSKGLDLRLRLPDGIEGLEAAVRAALPPLDGGIADRQREADSRAS